ncbi:MAG: hypothetical protein A3G23_11300 [Bacteroidetes bacterium RIFCSPLOWO2_12_FULL_37_12]|nr:MAG: hypothetical protein A3G23_11300 [Bacteroidetes bacterium RIFCSPLOWO2_12_FULL_37_12]
MNKSKNSFFIVVTFYFILNCDAVFSQTGNITTDQDGKLIYNNVTVVTPQPTENEIQQRNYEKEKYLKKNNDNINKKEEIADQNARSVNTTSNPNPIKEDVLINTKEENLNFREENGVKFIYLKENETQTTSIPR